MGRHKKQLSRDDRKEARRLGNTAAANAVARFRQSTGLSVADGDRLKVINVAWMDNYQLRTIIKAARQIAQFGAAANYELSKRDEYRARIMTNRERALLRAASAASDERRYGEVRAESARLREEGVDRAMRLTLMASFAGTKFAQRGARVLNAAHHVK